VLRPSTFAEHDALRPVLALLANAGGRLLGIKGEATVRLEQRAHGVESAIGVGAAHGRALGCRIRSGHAGP